MKYWLLYLLSVSTALSGMQAEILAERGDVKMIRIRASSRNEDAELASIALCLFFKGNECDITRDIKERLKLKIHDIRHSDDDIKEETFDRMRRLTPPHKTKGSSALRRQLRKDKELEDMINGMVMDALREYGEDKDRAIAYLEQRAWRKECHKRIAIGIALLSVVAATTTNLVVNFVD